MLPAERAQHPPRILLLYGSVRERSYSRLLTEEAARLLHALGAEARIYDPRGLPQPDGAPDDHPKVRELHALVQWAEGMVWTSPERHGAMTGIMKMQIDWIPRQQVIPPIEVEVVRTPPKPETRPTVQPPLLASRMK